MDGGSALEFHRCLDGLVYRYWPVDAVNGRPCWCREDREDLLLCWSEQHGWIVCDVEGTIFSRPWELEKDAQDGLPPLGIWVSRKGPKSYVYELKAV